MIAFSRTAAIAPGKTAKAIEFTHEIAIYMNSLYGVDLEVLLPNGGNPWRIAWSARCEDLAALDHVNAKVLEDKHFWKIVGKSTDNFLSGSIRDSLWRVV